MSGSAWDDLIGRMRVVLALEPALTPDETQQASDLIDVGEPGIAFELVCTQIYEHHAVVTQELRDSLQKLGTRIGVDPKYWRVLGVVEQLSSENS
jgi:hypothetical protein